MYKRGTLYKFPEEAVRLAVMGVYALFEEIGGSGRLLIETADETIFVLDSQGNYLERTTPEHLDFSDFGRLDTLDVESLRKYRE
jgi:hypothetical protein